MQDLEIIMRANDPAQVFLEEGAIFYGRRMLTPLAEEFIIEEATHKQAGRQIWLKLYISQGQAEKIPEYEKRFRQHFHYRKNKSGKQLKESVKAGFRSLIISIVFLTILISLALVIVRFVPEGNFSITFREVLIILGWVALWRPADLLLYEWRPFKREIQLFGRLENCRLEIITGDLWTHD